MVTSKDDTGEVRGWSTIVFMAEILASRARVVTRGRTTRRRSTEHMAIGIVKS